MNRIALVIWAWLAYALEAGLEPLWRISTVTPSPLLVLLAWVSLRARGGTVGGSVFWAGVFLGLLADLQPGANAGAAVIGPHAVAFPLAGWAVLRVRSMVFRDGLAPLVAAAGGVTLIVGVVVMTILQLRHASWLTADTSMVHPLRSEVGRWLLRAIYTAVLAVVMGWAMMKVKERWRP